MRAQFCSLACVAACACGGSPDGIYRLEQRTVFDDCSPRALSGDRGEVAVDSSAGVFVLARDEGQGTPEFSVRVRDEFDLAGRTAVAHLEACGQTVDIETVRRLLHEGTPLEASVVTRFSIPDGCDPSSEPRLPSLPSASCRVEQTLSYTLISVCESPCRMKWYPGDPTVAAGTLWCECPQ